MKRLATHNFLEAVATLRAHGWAVMTRQDFLQKMDRARETGPGTAA